MQNFENILQSGENFEKEIHTAAHALMALRARHGDGAPIISEFAEDFLGAYDKIEKIKSLASQLPNPDIQQIFMERYIFNKTWEEIAMELNFSAQHVHRLHGQGLSWLKENWEELEI